MIRLTLSIGGLCEELIEFTFVVPLGGEEHRNFVARCARYLINFRCQSQTQIANTSFVLRDQDDIVLGATAKALGPFDLDSLVLLRRVGNDQGITFVDDAHDWDLEDVLRCRYCW